MTRDQLEKIRLALSIGMNLAVCYRHEPKWHTVDADIAKIRAAREIVLAEMAKPDQSARIAELEAEVERLSLDLAFKDHHGH